MVSIEEIARPGGLTGLPPITAAARRAERLAAKLALAARLGRVPAPPSSGSARIVTVAAPQRAAPMARMIVPIAALPVTGEGRRERIPDDVIEGFLLPASVPADFEGEPDSPDERAGPRPPSVKAIIAAVADHYGLSRIDLLSARRTHTVVRPRQLAMWLAATLTHASLPEIGRRFGGRDHTTVLHARRATDKRIEGDPCLRADATAIVDRLTGGAR